MGRRRSSGGRACMRMRAALEKKRFLAAPLQAPLCDREKNTCRPIRPPTKAGLVPPGSGRIRTTNARALATPNSFVRFLVPGDPKFTRPCYTRRSGGQFGKCLPQVFCEVEPSLEFAGNASGEEGLRSFIGDAARCTTNRTPESAQVFDQLCT